MNLYFITGNKNKFEEVKSSIPEVRQLDIDLVEIQEIDPQKIIEHKLLEAFKHQKGEFTQHHEHGAGFIVEDTSLYLECLNGLPGPLIKWFLKAIGNEGLFELAKTMENYKTAAKTIIGYAKSKDEISFFEGEIKGSIVAPRGTSGFGWDPIFQPQGSSKTFAEMTQREKNQQKFNMRRIAIAKLLVVLKK